MKIATELRASSMASRTRIPAADRFSRNAARDAILRLAERLNLANSERRSYLCLLLDLDGRKESQKAQEAT